MANIIITGHGDFSLGMLHAAEMIAGQQEKMKAVPFNESESLEFFVENLKKSVDGFSTEEKETIIFADLKGGTPFNQAMLIHMQQEDVYVVGGVNLAMLIEAVGLNMANLEAKTIIELAINSAKEGIYSSLEFNQSVKEETAEEGI